MKGKFGRFVGQVSFAEDNEHEQGLLAHAQKPENGPFSVYVKRLIAWDMKMDQENPVQAQAPLIHAPVQIPIKEVANNTDVRDIARSFL